MLVGILYSRRCMAFVSLTIFVPIRDFGSIISSTEPWIPQAHANGLFRLGFN